MSGMDVHTFNSRTGEAEAGGTLSLKPALLKRAPGYLGLHGKTLSQQQQ